MPRKNYTVDEVVNILRKKQDIAIIGNLITINSEGTSIGNKSNGKLDFLTNHNGFTRRYLSSFDFNHYLTELRKQYGYKTDSRRDQ